MTIRQEASLILELRVEKWKDQIKSMTLTGRLDDRKKTDLLIMLLERVEKLENERASRDI